MPYTQADLDTIDAAIATGAKRVRFGSGPDAQEVEYRSLAEMRSARDMVAGVVNGTASGPRVTLAEHLRD